MILMNAPQTICRLMTTLMMISITMNAVTVRGAEPIQLSGTPEQIGTRWGELNRDAIVRDLKELYLNPAEKAGISREELLKRSEDTLRIIQEIAPHWLEESRAVARAAGVDEELYVSYVDGQVRDRFLHECTSYAVFREAAKNEAILFHKNRDNRDRVQAAFMVDSSLPGINKFIAISDASRMTCSMMVNEQGVAGAADYPADHKKDSSNLTLPAAEPEYRGLMSDIILRQIAERAGTSQEALAILEKIVAKGHYAGGKVNGNHWLFVDRHGTIIEACNNSHHVISKIHRQKAYFSQLNKSAAATRLRAQQQPIDFHTFHNVSRDPSICFATSISGMTVEIDPDHPEMLTCAWIALPARSVAFPVFMGQDQVPVPLMNGTSHQAAKQNSQPVTHWEELERELYLEKEQLKQEILASIEAGNPRSAHVEQIEAWSIAQSERLGKALKSTQPTSVQSAVPAR